MRGPGRSVDSVIHASIAAWSRPDPTLANSVATGTWIEPLQNANEFEALTAVLSRAKSQDVMSGESDRNTRDAMPGR